MIFVTGGAGFIGSNFVFEWLTSKNEPVVNIDKLTYAGNLQNLARLEGIKSHIFIHGDIADSNLVSELLNKYQPRAVLNFAAETHVDRSIQAPDSFIQTNIVGTFRLLESTRIYWNSLSEHEKSDFRFLHVSTDEVYGSLDSSAPASTEMQRYAPNNPYSASKAASEHIARAYSRTYGLPMLITNSSNNYGPYHFPEKLIPLIITNALAGKKLPIYGDGMQTRDWLYVKDNCNAIRKVLELGAIGEVYNIGCQNEKSNKEVVNQVCLLLDELSPKADGSSYSSQIIFTTDRMGHDQRYAIDATKIQTQLGWQPYETFESGLRKTVIWYLVNSDWVKKQYLDKQ